MNTSPKHVTRGELYDAVWNKPLTKLAKEWNTSYAHITRACENLNVPRPDSYHWTLISRGMQFERHPLPEALPETPTECELPVTRHMSPVPSNRPINAPAPNASLSEQTQGSSENRTREARPTPELDLKGKCLTDLTREELYRAVWASPVTEVAAVLGISDVAVGKRCARLNVPKPSLGYWAKIAAGQKPIQIALPPDPHELQFQKLQEPVPSTFHLPGPDAPLHPAAIAFIESLKNTKPGPDKLVTKRVSTLPEVSISPNLIDATGRFLHVLVTKLEPRGIPFRKARSQYDTAYFERGQDRLYLIIDELAAPRDRTPEEKRRLQWQPQVSVLEFTGRLKISVRSERYGRSKGTQWIQETKTTLDQFLPRIVQGISAHFLDLERRRAEQEIQRQKSEAEWKLKQQEERRHEHQNNLAAIAHTRSADLIKAAEWWRIHTVITQFIAECESRWRTAQFGEISAEQQEWLSWARETAAAASPFELGYPNPSSDGIFDPLKVPFGGPYPPKRELPHPPTMPKIPQSQQSSYSYHQPEAKPYPYWLKYQR